MTEIDLDDYKAKLAIGIIVGHFKGSPESFGLFKSLATLSITSKTFNNLLDNLLVTLSCRCIRGGGCHFARNKLYGYIRTLNITGFLSCADAILQSFHQSVYIHIVTKCLLDIVKNSSYSFLSQYIAFLKSRGVIIPGRVFFKKNQRQFQGKFPGFKSMELVQALRIANENGWKDKALLLFDHLTDVYAIGDVDEDSNRKLEPIRQRISENSRLNFDGQLGNRLGQPWPYWDTSNYWRDSDYNIFLAPQRQRIAALPKEVFSQPIEKQPWFFGSDAPSLSNDALCEAFVVVFVGVNLTALKGKKRNRFKFNDEFLKDPRNQFYLPNDGNIKNLPLFQFYVSLVKQDLEAMTAIQQNGIDWSEVEQKRQPNPFIELLHHVNAPRLEVVQYLIDIGMPKQLQWPARRAIHDDQIPAIKLFLNAGAKLEPDLIIELLKKRPFMNIEQMQRLVAACIVETYSVGRLLLFALHDFQPFYKKYHIFSERKLTVLWIYKFGQAKNNCNYLQTLPKELIRVILDHMDELPVFYHLSKMILNLSTNFGLRFPTASDIIKSPYCTKLIMESPHRAWKRQVLINVVNNMPQSILRRDYNFGGIRNFICEGTLLFNDKIVAREKFWKFILKHESDPVVLKKIDENIFVRGPKLDYTEAFKTHNVGALRFYIENGKFEMPSREQFEAKMKPSKYNMTYEAALALIENLKSLK